MSTGRLQVDIAVKALDSSGSGRQSYEDTDGKKREFTGDSRPGVEKNEFGHRWEPLGKWDSSKRLVITPSHEDLNSISTAPNTGWVEKETPKFNSFEEMIAAIKKKPHIQLSKYKVDPRTDDIIPGSQKIIDPFAITSGLTFEERQRNLAKYKEENSTKILPGRSLASRIPGGTIVARAAAAIGILRDENNKFRCPPGTPAANQFTDRFGSNCFGFSASKFSRFAAREAAKAEAEGKMEGFRNTAKSFFNFLYTDNWGVGDSDPARLGRSPWYDAATGERFDSPDWRTVDVAEGQRIFKNGMVRAQDDLARQDAAMAELYSALEIDIDDEERAFKALDMLRKISVDTDGAEGWDLDIVNVSRGDSDASRMNPEQVEQYIKFRLEGIPYWGNLSKEEQDLLIKADVKRYYETERAFMESMLDHFMTNPSVAKFIGRLEFNFFSGDEAGSALYGGRGTPLRGVIHFNPEVILTNQESMLPNLGPDERLALNAVGASNDTAAKMALSDFLVNSTYAARHMAGLVDGPRSFTRHIGVHEIAHSIQELAFIEKIEQEINTRGFIRIPVRDKNGVIRGFRKVTSIDQLDGNDIMAMMKDTADNINLDALNSALSRAEVVSALAGSYPTQYTKGGEIWALEVTAELWALRKQGIIFGDDVDAALEWMDRIVDGRSATDRALSDLPFRQRDAEAVSDMPSDLDSPDIPEGELAESVKEASLRRVSQRRELLKSFKTDFETLEESEMFDESALIALRRDVANSSLEKAQQDRESVRLDGPLDGISEEEMQEASSFIETSVREAQADLDFYNKMYDDAKSIWRKKYGIGARGELARFDETVKRIRTEEGLFEPAEIARLARLAELDDLASSASKLNDKDLIRAIADKEIQIKTLEPGTDSMIKAAEELDILRGQYIRNKKDSGDRRTSAQIRKELSSEIETLVSPKPKKVKKFASDKEARQHALKERASLRGKISKEQADALKVIGDVDTSDIALMMKPELQPLIGRAINRRNARLKRLGLEVDPKSPEEASLDEQVQNILIPAMEAIDTSSIIDPFEMEIVIDVEPGTLSGRTVGKEVDIENMVSGRVMRRGMKMSDVPKGGKKDKATGKRKHKIIVQVREGDRGAFPETTEGEQKFIIPPGKLRVTGRDEDGTIRAEISYQMDVVETVDSMAKSLEYSTGEDDFIWRVGANRKVQAVVDKYVTERRAAGEIGAGPRSDYDRSIADTSTEIVDSVIDAGGSFGEPPVDFDDIGPDAGRLSSGRDVFGPVETRAQRKRTREKKVSSNIREVRKALGGGGSKQFPDMTRDSIDPEVARLINSMPDEQLLQVMEDAAYRLHSGFDRRVRVRMRDEDIDSLSETGKVRSTLSSPAVDDGMTRRARRLSGMSPQQREQRLSSGSVNSPVAQEEPQKIDTAISERRDRAATGRLSSGANRREEEINEAIRIANIDRTSSGSRPEPRSVTGRLAKLKKPRIRDSREDVELSRLSSGKTVEGANDSFVREYFLRNGLPESVSDEQLPVFGYLVHKSNITEKRKKIKSGNAGSLLPDAVFEIEDEDEIGDGLTALGDIEIVLKSGVSNRTAYGRGNAIASGHRPVRLNSRNRNDVLDSIVNTHGKNNKNSDMDAMMNLLSSSIDGDFSRINSSRDKNGKMPRTNKPATENPREAFQAQILGGFDVDEVEQVNYPFSRIMADSASIKIDDVVNEKTVATKLRAAGFSPEEIAYFYSISDGGGIDTESMQMLRNYRQAQKVKKSLGDKGFSNVRIAHPQGLDIENPITHSSAATPRDSVEIILTENIMREIETRAESLLKEIRRDTLPTVVSEAGAKL